MIVLAGSLWVIILLLGIILVLIIAFLTIAIALDTRLISSPFRLRLESFILSVL
jgi:hypothetical protein